VIWPAGIACVVVAVAAGSAGYKVRDLMADRDALARATTAAEQQRLVQRTRDKLQGAADAQATRYHARERQIDRAATADRAVVVGLRDALASVTAAPADPACPEIRRQRDILASLVGSAAGLVGECKEAGDRLAAQTAELRRSAAGGGQLPVTE